MALQIITGLLLGAGSALIVFHHRSIFWSSPVTDQDDNSFVDSIDDLRLTRQRRDRLHISWIPPIEYERALLYSESDHQGGFWSYIKQEVYGDDEHV